MHIRLFAFGTRGDVQPFVALGLGLQQAGFDVSLATALNFKSFVEDAGLACETTSIDLKAFMTQAKQKRAGKESPEQPGEQLSRWDVFRKFLDDTPRLAEGVDWLIYSPASAFSAPHVAEKLKIPTTLAMLQPYMHPTREFPVIGLPALPLGGWYNRLTYSVFDKLVGISVKSKINKWRQETLDLPPSSDSGSFAGLRRRRIPTLYGFSPAVLPKPGDWGDHIHVTGYWFLDHDPDWQPPDDLKEFLGAGPPPVYIGFGSMPSEDPEKIAGVVLDAVQQLGVRAVIASGWQGLQLSDLPENVFLLEACPHDWLFPQMAAVVHHGGAGTTAAGLRAGIPSIIVSGPGDQPFWGRRVTELGVGPAFIPRRKLTADKLAAAITEAVTDEAIQTQAAALGKTIRAEDGVGNAVQVIQDQIQNSI
jgi:sterol 3beta-glucosyltransferase